MSFWLGLDKLWFALTRLFLNLYTKASDTFSSADELGIPPQGNVVYVLRDAALTDLLVVERETRAMQLPSPLSSVDGTPLRRRHFSIYRRPLFGRDRVEAKARPLEQLIIALRNNPELDIQLVPVSVFWGRRPEKENSMWKILFSDNWSPPGFIKKFIIVLTQGRQLLVQFNPPMSLRDLVQETPENSRVLRKAQRILRVHFRRQREAIIGPDLSHRRMLVTSLIESPTVREAIAATAEKENIRLDKVEARARIYAREIASDYSHTVIRFLEVLLNWVWNRLYDGVRLYNIDKLRQVAQNHELVYVPCHRSHIDYLLLSFVVYRNNLVPPHIAAGINLNMPVVGSILRRGGAFFMRRSFKGNALYAAVFDEYMHTILTRGYSIEYFVEGGRSRSGRMLPPKTGMLAMTVRSFLRDSGRPIALVPVYVGYERVLESRSYIGEMHGQKKKKESVLGLLASSIALLRSHFGQVHVNFGDPVIVSDFLDDNAPQWREQRKAIVASGDTPGWLKQVINQLGNEVVTRINRAAVANPVNLLSLAVLSASKHTMDEEQLRRLLALYVTLLNDARYHSGVAVAESNPAALIEYGIAHNFVHRIEHPLGGLITAEQNTALEMTYVRNNTLHLFVLPGLISVLFNNAREIRRAKLRRLVHILYPFFDSEYFLSWETEQELDQAVDAVIAVLLQQGLILEEGELLKGAPSNSYAEDLLANLGLTVIQAIQRFSITVRLLVQYGSGTLSQEQLEKLAQQTAHRLALLNAFNSPEFSDLTVLKNFIAQLKKHQLLAVNSQGLLVFDERLEALDDEAGRILSSEVNQSILRITRLPAPVIETTPAPADTNQQGTP